MRRVYADVSDFRAPYDSPTLTLTGLGDPTRWPNGRRYYDISNFRAPYDEGYFQNNQLFGLGASPAQNRALFPEALRRYVETGEPMPAWRRDLAAASAQVPRWTWMVGAGVMLTIAYMSYKAHNKNGEKRQT